MAKPVTKIRVKEKDGMIWLRALIQHPMETGRRKDKVTGMPVPAHYVNDVVVHANGELVYQGEWSTSISENPFLFIQFDGANGDKVTFTWSDNLGNRGSVEKIVGR